MNNQDTVFRREFREMMITKSKTGNAVNILPSLRQMFKPAQFKNRAEIKGITEPFFEKLNNTECTMIFQTKVSKPQVKADGTYRRDAEGKVITDHIPVSRDCVAIVSDVNIKLRSGDENGNKYVKNDEYQYISYGTTSNGRKYLYIVPRSVVFRLNMVGLELTKTKRKNHYGSVKLAFTNGSYYHASIVPLKATNNAITDNIISFAKSSIDMGKEFKTLLDILLLNNLLIDPAYGEVYVEGVGTVNLVYEYTESTLVREDYRKTAGSLQEEKEQDVQTV